LFYDWYDGLLCGWYDGLLYDWLNYLLLNWLNHLLCGRLFNGLYNRLGYKLRLNIDNRLDLSHGSNYRFYMELYLFLGNRGKIKNGFCWQLF